MQGTADGDEVGAIVIVEGAVDGNKNGAIVEGAADGNKIGAKVDR